ncbi:MAG TPA: 3TM-type holin [Steroidobacteraceae bacterium]|jgi:hypothetical protein
MSIWDTVVSPIVSIINKVIPDKAAAAAAVAQLNQLQLQGQLADEMAQLQAVTVNQSDVNKVEAANPSVFVSGWRPMIGWVCGFALAYAAVIEPLARFVATVLLNYTGPFPVIDTSITLQVLFGLLGLGTLRTVEKFKGVAGGVGAH